MVAYHARREHSRSLERVGIEDMIAERGERRGKRRLHEWDLGDACQSGGIYAKHRLGYEQKVLDPKH